MLHLQSFTFVLGTAYKGTLSYHYWHNCHIIFSDYFFTIFTYYLAHILACLTFLLNFISKHRVGLPNFFVFNLYISYFLCWCKFSSSFLIVLFDVELLVSLFFYFSVISSKQISQIGIHSAACMVQHVH